ncbi:hypothetical protein H072_615 [Dactylellina haptotyla CBS 200.50]|uniref:Uncharacterized protein n=1 Tax=Dactylellina haptotyla (strain CBS 200.50) TaxID=1284197 RepID=S8ARA3_DACHA|nr:hypothetical protein H072_615 [Dactylellina haptotyla CBS 200.50]
MCSLKTFLISISFLILLSPSSAFIPQKWKSFNGAPGISHAEQTERAIKELWVPWFGFDVDDFTALELYMMNNAIDEIATANGMVDNDQTDGALHFDGESFTQAQERLLDLANQTIRFTKEEQYHTARSTIGQALHTLQDFYSHSNWIELLLAQGVDLVPHPGVGVSGAMLYPLSSNISTCNQCNYMGECGHCHDNLETGSLTSGYYSGQPNYKKPQAGKCSHGGLMDGSSTDFDVGFRRRGQGINKDSTSCIFSPHKDLHYDAASVSINATKIYLTNEIFNKLEYDEARVLFGNKYKKNAVSKSLGSLWDTIKDLIQPDKRLPSGPARRSFANTSKHHSHTFVIAEDIPEDRMILARVMASHKMHSIQIIRRDTQQNETSGYSWDDIAVATGGHALKVCENDTNNALEFLDMIAQPGHVEVLSVARTPNGNTNGSVVEYSFPVDSSLESVLISASGVSSFELFFPNGSLYPTNSSDKRDIHVRQISNNVALNMSSITRTGLYRIALHIVDNYTLSVSGYSKLYLSSFNFVEEAGRPGHEGHFPILDSPIVGENTKVEAVMHGNFTSGAFEFRTKANTLIAKQESIKVDERCRHHGTRFQGLVTEIPDTNFMVYFSGVNDKGEAFQRARLHLVTPSKVQIDMPRIMNIRAGHSHIISIGIKNLNNVSDTFDITAVDAQGVVSGASNNTISLDAGAMGLLDIRLYPTLNTTLGTDYLVVSAKGRRTNGNFAFQTVIIEAEEAFTQETSITHQYFASETKSLILKIKEEQNKR